MKAALAVAGLLWLCSASPPVHAINKCSAPNGQVIFQDAPCKGEGQPIVVRPASGPAQPAAPRLPEPPSTAPEQRVATPAVPPQKPPAKSQLDLDAERCLAWYRPLLRDPAGAYYSEPKRENRVVTITLHGTNGYGGYETKQAACEIHVGRLNESWTKTHARRLGWGVD